MLLSKEGISYLYFWPIPDRSIHHVINFASFRRSPAPPRLFVHVAAYRKHSEETKVQQVRTPVSELLSASDRDGKPCPRIPRAQGFSFPQSALPAVLPPCSPTFCVSHRAAGNKGRKSAIQIRAKTRDQGCSELGARQDRAQYTLSVLFKDKTKSRSPERDTMTGEILELPSISLPYSPTQNKLVGRDGDRRTFLHGRSRFVTSCPASATVPAV